MRNVLRQQLAAPTSVPPMEVARGAHMKDASRQQEVAPIFAKCMVEAGGALMRVAPCQQQIPSLRPAAMICVWHMEVAGDAHMRGAPSQLEEAPIFASRTVEARGAHMKVVPRRQ